MHWKYLGETVFTENTREKRTKYLKSKLGGSVCVPVYLCVYVL